MYLKYISYRCTTVYKLVSTGRQVLFITEIYLATIRELSVAVSSHSTTKPITNRNHSHKPTANHKNPNLLSPTRHMYELSGLSISRENFSLV